MKILTQGLVYYGFFQVRDVLTPQDYKMFVEVAFGPANAGLMQDVWVVPDCSSIVTPEMDKKFSKYCREVGLNTSSSEYFESFKSFIWSSDYVVCFPGLKQYL